MLSEKCLLSPTYCRQLLLSAVIGASSYWRQFLLAPSLERLGKRPLAGRALFERQDGATIVVVDDGDVEPGAVLQQLHVALTVGVARRQADQEEAGGHLDGKAGERRAAALLGLLHQNAGHIRDTARGEILRQAEHDLDSMARRQVGIAVTAQRPRHGNAALRDL